MAGDSLIYGYPDANNRYSLFTRTFDGTGREEHTRTRLTDVFGTRTFALEGDACAGLREAYLNRGVVLTPHPQAHALGALRSPKVIRCSTSGAAPEPTR